MRWVAPIALALLSGCQTTTPAARIDWLEVRRGQTTVTCTNLVIYRYKPAEIAGAVTEGLVKGAGGLLKP